MLRRIIHIDKEKCNGCGLCAAACHEGAIGMVNGKAELMRDDYCDGLGDCLPACPAGAITFIEREAAAYDETAVQKNKQNKQKKRNIAVSESASAPEAAADISGASGMLGVAGMAGGCPGSRIRQFNRAEQSRQEIPETAVWNSELRQWPIQIKLAPVVAPYFNGARLLIAADCTAYAYGRFHQDFMKGKVTLIGCPKLDSVEYSEKLTQIIRRNDMKSITVVRMEVPCCGGIEQAVKNALMNSGKMIPWQVVVISTEGNRLD